MLILTAKLSPRAEPAEGNTSQLMSDDYHFIEIMLDYESEKIITPGDLIPKCWIQRKALNTYFPDSYLQ